MLDYSKNDRGACSTLHPTQWLAEMGISIPHERCKCKEWIVDNCKKACDNDANCKGFVQTIAQDKDWNWYSYGCEYATVNGASTCESSGCSYVKSDGETTDIGDLLDQSGDGAYCGCWRKVISMIWK